MKTQDELKAHYRDVIIPMVAKYNFDHGTDVKPWECVRICEILEHVKHPEFNGGYAYTFAQTILEGKPVFVGDVVYYKKDMAKIIVGEAGIIFNPDNWTWTPQPKKRTFMLSGVELPCPVKNAETPHWICIEGKTTYFWNSKEAKQVGDAINNTLTEARDKE